MLSGRRLIAIGAVLAVATAGIALADPMPNRHSMGPAHVQDMRHQHHSQGMMAPGAHAGLHAGTAAPTMPGQDAFGAIQEIVRLLEADATTDWSKVDLETLRQHLIDMNEVTLNADAAATPIDGGLEIAITGSGRTLDAIRRMVPAHPAELNGLNGWSAKTAPLPSGVQLTVTAADPKEVAHIRGLGFIGLMASGAHHQAHHLAMAKGGFVHAH